MRSRAVHSFVATRFLPHRKRDAAEALYALVRTADDLADEPGIPNKQRHQGLATIEAAIAHLRDEKYVSDAPWFSAAQRAFAHFPIAIEDLQKTLTAFRADIDGTPCRTMEDIERYGAMVSGAVARCAMPVLGAADADSLDRAERLGIAIQLSNILRDLDADRRIGRRYLPASLPHETEADVIRRVAELARHYYCEAQILAKRLPNDGSRAALLAAASLYEGTLDGRLSTIQKVQKILRSLVRAYI